MPRRWSWRTVARRCSPGPRTCPRRWPRSRRSARPATPGGEHAPMRWDWTPETRAKLAIFLEVRGLTRGDVTTQPIGDGHSNLTFLVSDGSRQVVVRRPPPPPTPPGAHDTLREARLVAALAGTAVPGPPLLPTARAAAGIN